MLDIADNIQPYINISKKSQKNFFSLYLYNFFNYLGALVDSGEVAASVAGASV